MPFKITGPSFMALQVSDIEKSKQFYTELLGLEIDPHGPPHAFVFKTTPISFAIRQPDIDLKVSTKLGWGVRPWFQASGVQDLFHKLQAENVNILTDIQPGPFGSFFTFTDPDGYVLTVHEPQDA